MKPGILTMISYTKQVLRAILMILIFGLISAPGCHNARSSGGQAEEDYTGSFPRYAEMTPERAAVSDSLKSYFNRLHQSGFNGTVLFAENGEIVFAQSYGFCDLQRRDSLTMESAFQLASISKPITALSVLMLTGEGKLAIDDSVSKFIPDLPYAGITIRHLLNHRSGLPNYMYFAEELWPDKNIPLANRDVIDLMIIHRIKPYGLPDRRYNYSNTNYALLAYIVEQVSGMRFEDFVQTRIFDPLHMVNSSIYNKKLIPENPQKVTGYPSSRAAAENTFLNGVVGDKGVYASAYDLLRLDRALYSGRLVDQSLLDEAFKPQHADLRPNDNYGLGWRLDVADTLNPAIYHTGWWKGFRTYFIREPAEQRTIIILSNTLRASRFNVRELREIF